MNLNSILGLLKKAIRIRPDLKVIITSATLDIKKFADYFGAPMVKIPGKVFPVDLEYLPTKHDPNNHNLPIQLNPPAPLRYRIQVLFFDLNLIVYQKWDKSTNNSY